MNATSTQRFYSDHDTLPATSTDRELIAYVDKWATLLEKEAYSEAFELTDHDPEMGWSPELIRKVIKSYGEASPVQRVTLEGKPTDIKQRKEVTRCLRTD